MTFISKCGSIRITVDDNFRYRCPEPEIEDFYTLIHTFKMGKFLHNTQGPAIYNMATHEAHYYLHGKQVDKNQVDQIVFNEQMGKFLNDNE